MDGKIVLDSKSFEAISVDTRIRLLKALSQRRKTLSELSEELSMSVSGVKEHIENLENAALIRRVDDGHKWKYYELTDKGVAVVKPGEVRVWILLSASVLALLSLLFLYIIAPSITPNAQFSKNQQFYDSQSEAQKTEALSLPRLCPLAGTTTTSGLVVTNQSALAMDNEVMQNHSNQTIMSNSENLPSNESGNASNRQTLNGTTNPYAVDNVRPVLIILIMFCAVIAVLSVMLLYYGKQYQNVSDTT